MSTSSLPAKPFDAESPAIKKMLADLQSNWKMRYFYFKRLPSVWWWGISVESISPTKTIVKIPFTWRTQNPFRSIYFSALLGTGELSTGLMALLAIHDRGKISMLVTKMESEFTKKAIGTTYFSCDEGDKILDCVQKAIDTGEGHSVMINSTGALADGTVVCRMKIYWSFKVKA